MNKLIKKTVIIESIHIDGDLKRYSVLENGSPEIINVLDSVTLYEDEYFTKISFEDLEVGESLSVYTWDNSPVLLSYPPQYSPLLIIANRWEEDYQEVSGHFDDDLLHQDKMIKINDATITRLESLKHPNFVKELLKNRELLVFYRASTRSIPALINPIKIIVLD